MGDSFTSHLQNAEHLLQKSQFDKALTEFENALAEEPDNPELLKRVGELQVHLHRTEAAALTFQRLGGLLTAEGFLLKAVSVFKSSLKLNDRDLQTHRGIAEAYFGLGMAPEATHHLRLLADYLSQQGEMDDVLSIFRKLVVLNPGQAGLRQQLAEMYIKFQMPKEATAELKRAAKDLNRQNQLHEYIQVMEQLSGLQPEHLATLRELSTLYLQIGEAKRALSKLQVAYRLVPEDLEVLEQMAQAFLLIHQPIKSATIYKQMANILAGKGQQSQADALVAKASKLAPASGHTPPPGQSGNKA